MFSMWGQSIDGRTSAVASALALTLLQACANGPGSTLNGQAPSWAYGDSGTAHGATTGSECGTDGPNVVSSYEGDEPGSFTACADEADFYSFTLTGSLVEGSSLSWTGGEETKRLCVLPGQRYEYEDGSGAVVYWKQDHQGFPMYDCAAVDGDEVGAIEPLTFTFDQTNFDFIYVVDEDHLLQMRTCLMSGDRGSCPDFAEGLFREVDWN